MNDCKDCPFSDSDVREAVLATVLYLKREVTAKLADDRALLALPDDDPLLTVLGGALGTRKARAEAADNIDAIEATAAMLERAATVLGGEG